MQVGGTFAQLKLRKPSGCVGAFSEQRKQFFGHSSGWAARGETSFGFLCQFPLLWMSSAWVWRCEASLSPGGFGLSPSVWLTSGVSLCVPHCIVLDRPMSNLWVPVPLIAFTTGSFCARLLIVNRRPPLCSLSPRGPLSSSTMSHLLWQFQWVSRPKHSKRQDTNTQRYFGTLAAYLVRVYVWFTHSLAFNRVLSFPCFPNRMKSPGRIHLAIQDRRSKRKQQGQKLPGIARSSSGYTANVARQPYEEWS